MRSSTSLAISTLCFISVTLAAEERAKWSGFSALQKLVVFGDSYSTIGFNPDGVQPSTLQPFGVKTWKKCNGPAWPEFLTTVYKQSSFLTYDMAVGGSTVDLDIVDTPTNSSFAIQVDRFIQRYGSEDGFANASTSLYALSFGINDVVLTTKYHENSKGPIPSVESSDGTFAAVISRYHDLIKILHDKGARNFLIINVPPADRAPLIYNSKNPDQIVPYVRDTVKSFNERLVGLRDRVQRELPGSNTFFYDAYTDLMSVQDNPSEYPETAGYRDTTKYCVAYEHGTPSMDHFDKSCDYATQEYYYMDHIHPSWPTYKLLARRISDLLLTKESSR